jgi:tetratricopeptide (TPR) repeat protein
MRLILRFIGGGLLATTMVVAAHAQAGAAALSDVLARKIIEAQKAEADRLFEIALANYGEAIGLSKNTPEGARLILKKRAALYEQINMVDRAEADLSQAIKTEPFDPKTLSDRGYFYIRQNRISDALDDFVRGSKVKPTDAEFPYGAARALVAKGDFKNALKFYGEAIERAPNDGKLYLGRAEAEVRLAQYDQAMTDYNQAFTLGIPNRDDRFFAFTGRGYISLMNADFGIAVDSFTRALEISPGASNVLLWRGYAFERQGKRDLALRDFQDALAASPNSEEARSNLARLRTQMAESGQMPR